MEKINHGERSFPPPPTYTPICPVGVLLPVPPQRSQARVCEAATGVRVAGGQRAECRRPGEEHSGQNKEKRDHRPQDRATLRTQFWSH